MIFTEDEVIELVKEHSQRVQDWIIKARENSAELNALVRGEGFHELLINRIEFIESDKKSLARKKYSKDIRDLFKRINKKRENVFDANGGGEQIKITNDTVLNNFKNKLSNFKSNKSLFEYLSNDYFNLLDIDPNGLVMLEYKTENEELVLYPTYKAIKDIRYYQSNGQLLDFLIFENKEEKLSVLNQDSLYKKYWRVVDDSNDWTIVEIGGVFVVDKNKTFEHPFGQVPAIILSSTEKIGENIRENQINCIIEQGKDYARDKSILTIYKFLNGFPKHWRFSSRCTDCSGVGKLGDETCKSCDGKGILVKSDVTDILNVPIPEEGQPNLAPHLGGYISPDLETWKQYNDDLKAKEILMEDTLWGTDKAMQFDNKSETATGRYIDVQPIANALNEYSTLIEYVYNTLANWILNFVDPSKQDKKETLYIRTFGRRYIIESPDILLEKYQIAKKNGDNTTILDKLLDEFILSKYKSDPQSQELMSKKAKLEPYVHFTNKEIFDYFGQEELQKRVLFEKFWIECDKQKDEIKLKLEFEQYYKNNKIKLIEENNNSNNQNKKKDESSSSSEES